MASIENTITTQLNRMLKAITETVNSAIVRAMQNILLHFNIMVTKLTLVRLLQAPFDNLLNITNEIPTLNNNASKLTQLVSSFQTTSASLTNNASSSSQNNRPIASNKQVLLHSRPAIFNTDNGNFTSLLN